MIWKVALRSASRARFRRRSTPVSRKNGLTEVTRFIRHDWATLAAVAGAASNQTGSTNIDALLGSAPLFLGLEQELAGLKSQVGGTSVVIEGLIVGAETRSGERYAETPYLPRWLAS